MLVHTEPHCALCCLGLFCWLYAVCNCSKTIIKGITLRCLFSASVCTKFFCDILGELIFYALLLAVSIVKIISVSTFLPILPFIGSELTEVESGNKHNIKNPFVLK